MQFLWSSLIFVIASLVSFHAQAQATCPSINTVVQCEGGDLMVEVFVASGQKFLVVYDQGSAVVYQEAARKVALDSDVTLVTYQAGNVWEGGARLSIRTADRRFPRQQGVAHLSMRRGGDMNNFRIFCSLYEPAATLAQP